MWNPEQTALEDMVKVSPWKDMIYVHDFTRIHSYPRCFERDGKVALNLHFAGAGKEQLVDQYSKDVQLHDDIE